MGDRRHLLVVLATALAVLVVDGATKLLTVTRLEDAPVDLGWVVLRSARNTGVSFGLGADAPSWVVLGVTVAATLAIVVMAVRRIVQPAIAGGLLVGGGLGNLIDRIPDGAVVDMVDLGWFPVFNAADVALNIGVGLVLVHGLFFAEDEDEPTPPADGDGTGSDDGPVLDAVHDETT